MLMLVILIMARKEAKNFSSLEKLLLTKMLEQYRQIIEDKKRDIKQTNHKFGS